MTLSPIDSPDEPSETTALTESDRMRLLASDRRRVLLDVVEDRTMPVDLETLATAVGAAEFDGREPDPETIDRVGTSLHHNHLPRLDDAGLLDYDANSNHVTSVGELPLR